MYWEKVGTSWSNLVSGKAEGDGPPLLFPRLTSSGSYLPPSQTPAEWQEMQPDSPQLPASQRCPHTAVLQEGPELGRGRPQAPSVLWSLGPSSPGDLKAHLGARTAASQLLAPTETPL